MNLFTANKFHSRFIGVLTGYLDIQRLFRFARLNTRPTGDDARELNPDWEMAELIFGKNSLSKFAADKLAISKLTIRAVEIDVCGFFLKKGGLFFVSVAKKVSDQVYFAVLI